MKYIIDSGDMTLTLNLGVYCKHEVISIPVIQFIIGDCKGNLLLCGKKGSNSLNMNRLCRDCDIHPSDGNNMCIGK